MLRAPVVHQGAIFGAQKKRQAVIFKQLSATSELEFSGEDRLRTVAENAAIRDAIQQCGAESGAVGPEIGDSDARLTAVIEAWPTLSEATKEEIAALVQAAGIAAQ